MKTVEKDQVAADTGRRDTRVRFDGPLLLLLVAALAAGVFAFVRHALVDDAYITAAYARNLAFHLHWGLIPQQTSNTATSPFNVMVLGLFTLVLRRPVVAVGVVYVLAHVMLAFSLRRVGARTGLPGWFPLLSVALLLVNPLLVSSIGLEVALGSGLLGLLLLAAVEGRAVLFGVFAGLLALTRLDLLVFVAVIFLCRRGAWRGWWRSMLAFMLVAGPWFVFSWSVLGSAVPDTLIIKTLQKPWAGKYDFTNGALYYQQVYPAATILSFGSAVLGLLALLAYAVTRLTRLWPPARRLDLLAPLALGGLLHFLAYTQLQVPPYHWYYGPSITALTIFLAGAGAALASASTSALAGGATRIRRWPSLVGASVVVLLMLVIGAGMELLGGVGKPLSIMPITTNWALSQQYAAIGKQLPGLIGNQPVAAGGEIGAIAFYCECRIIDVFSDRGRMFEVIEQSKQSNDAIGRRLIDLNFQNLDHGMKPTAPRFALQFVPTEQIDRRAIATWPVTSQWVGNKALQLVAIQPG